MNHLFLTGNEIRLVHAPHVRRTDARLDIRASM